MEFAALRVVAGQLQGEAERAHAAVSSDRLDALSRRVARLHTENAELHSLLGMFVASVPFLGAHFLDAARSPGFRRDAVERLMPHWPSIRYMTEVFLMAYPDLWRGHYEEFCRLYDDVHREYLAGGLRGGDEELGEFGEEFDEESDEGDDERVQEGGGGL